MAEIVVSAIITVVCEKLISGDLLKLARSEGIDSQLKKWKKDLPIIQAVLADASQKQITDRAVQLWVNELQDLAYDIDDVLDDLATEAMRRELNQEAIGSTSNVTGKVLKLFPNCCTNFTPRKIMYGRQISSKLDEITTKLSDLVDQKTVLKLDENVRRSNRTEKRLEQTSLVDESKIMGREGDKVTLLGKLLGNEECVENVRTVSIVGMGGIGKTTLAKLLYNDEKVKKHFELRTWVCVSEEWDVYNISKAIFQAVTGRNENFANLDLLHVALKEELSKKRFLLVLDDVWNEEADKWEQLQSVLLGGAPGSRVIVTTRSDKVASVMGSKESYDLRVLSDDDALSLFAIHAVGENNFGKHPTLKLLGKDIVKKCGNLPLALKTLGGTLNGKRNVDEWENLLKSEIWDLEDGSKILPSLRLSYYHLPAHLKQLFAYCSLIPKDYVFDKNKLVLLWVAEGFLSQLEGNGSMECLGHQCFEELMSRSFIQHSIKDGESRYTMHDLINDLATNVAGEFSFRLDAEMDVSGINEAFYKFRHFSLIGLRNESCKKLKELERAKCLRTLLLMPVGWNDDALLDNVLVELLPKLQFLRVLSVMELSPWSPIGQHVEITEVPESIGSLKHLRYLNFSCTKITYLPEQVSSLYNLQSLFVHNCHRLSNLPKSFSKLKNLRHLDISDTPRLKKMPLGIAGLTSLQTLSKVIVEEADGFKISDLKDLSDLQGHLSILGVEKVTNSTQAADANLLRKKDLDVLEMEWSDKFDDSRNDMIEYEVLNELRPTPKLKKLEILNYKGTRFPGWVGDPSFDQLTELRLCGCRSTHLPTLGSLGSLKNLSVKRMSEVKNVGYELLAPTNSFHGIAFPSLEVMEFEDMEGWQKWSINIGGDDGTPRSFPRLYEICIKRCPKLDEVSIGLIPSLLVLHIKNCSEAVFRSMVGLSSSLIKVRFSSCDTPESYNCPNTVIRLAIEDCGSMKSLTFSRVQEHPSSSESPMSRLTDLTILRCENLKSISHEHFHSLTALEEMWILDCPSMDYSFPCGVWPPNLRFLEIGRLNKPMSEWGVQSFPTSLVHLHLYGENSGVVSFAVADDVRNTSPSSSSFLLPPSLVTLRLYGFEDVESFSEVLQHLPCLKRLEIWRCPKIRDIKETSDSAPSNLIITVW